MRDSAARAAAAARAAVQADAPAAVRAAVITEVSDDFLTLGIETSCDDTAVALLRGAREVVADVVSSQIDEHSPFGGVVPELASRMHQEALLPLVRAVLADAHVEPSSLGLIAVTSGPGLMGSLLVGVMTAKALSQGWGVPLIGVDHLEGHIFAGVAAHAELAPPFLCLIVSGGHTEIVLARGYGDYELLGSTRDDAAGEAYDKAAKMLGLGYPGGPIIERLASRGDDRAFDFPVAFKRTSEVEFSFSGTKTAFRTEVERIASRGGEMPTADLCASFQRAITDALLTKVMLAVERTGVRRVAISGGVAANAALRTRLSEMGARSGFDVYLPPRRTCTDNAVMIAAAGYAAYMRGERSDLTLSPDPSHEIWSR